MRTTYLFIFLGLLASCELHHKERTEKSDPESNDKAASLSNCYQYAGQGDTVTLRLVHVGENITGILVYQFKEKDSNKGTIMGFMRGDTLLARYTFISEGTQSVRQVAFKKTGNSFVEGYGESVDENGIMKFKNTDSLNFSSSFKLEEVACP